MAALAFMLACARAASVDGLACGKVIPKEYEASHDHNVELRDAIVNVAGLDYEKVRIFFYQLKHFSEENNKKMHQRDG